MFSCSRIFIWTVALLSAAASAQSIESTLRRLDAQSKGFRGASAHLRIVSFNHFAMDTDEQSGRIFLYRPSPQDMRILVELTKPEDRAVAFAKNKVQMYYPKVMLVQEYDFRKASHLVEQYVVLGFGASSRELRTSYSMKHAEATMTNGVMADHLVLEPKSAEVRDQIRSIDLWIAQPSGYPVRMKLLQSSRDTMEFEYTDVKINPSWLTEASVQLKLPKGVKTERPQQ